MNESKAAAFLGSRGGKATLKKLGKEHYQKLAAQTNKKRWGLRDAAKKYPGLPVCNHGVNVEIGKCKYGCTKAVNK